MMKKSTHSCQVLHTVCEIRARFNLFNVQQDMAQMEIPLLVFANKSDLPSALSEDDIDKQFELTSIHGRKW
ncbi:unnamed protein product [Arabis nemorensis]|uniref:Uncharacterized protein n=1 Tax=Arabis nemorensis TaxID=586526 RepID=A0A565CIZ0_9BRAS|nr:unnamed protein product [Arabis nemorensis]